MNNTFFTHGTGMCREREQQCSNGVTCHPCDRVGWWQTATGHCAGVMFTDKDVNTYHIKNLQT